MHPRQLNWAGFLNFCFEPMAFPCSKFFIANTVAKWKMLEPNEIDFSQGLARM